MVLNGHGSLLSVHHTSTCAIVEVDVCHLYTFRQRLGIYGVVVVLCTDLNASCKAEKPSLRCAWSSQIMLNRKPRFGELAVAVHAMTVLEQYLHLHMQSHVIMHMAQAHGNLRWCRESSNVNIADSAA